MLQESLVMALWDPRRLYVATNNVSTFLFAAFLTIETRSSLTAVYHLQYCFFYSNNRVTPRTASTP
jgi:hypothetical protein